MLVAQIQDNYEIGLGEIPVPPLPPRGALVKVVGCGVCGSDLDKFIHHKASPGSVLGHEVVGIIEALDDDHPAGWKLGDRIVSAHHVPCLNCHYCMNGSESMCRHFKHTNLNPGGFAQYIALTEAHLNHTAFKVPAHVTPPEASCVEPLACVLRAVRRGGQHLNGSVLIVGLGFIGMMAAQVYKNQGYQVFGVDLDSERLALAQAEGFVSEAFHAVEQRDGLKDALTRCTALGQVDLAFLSVVNPKTLNESLARVRDGGSLVVFTSAAANTPVDPSQLYFREINLITSYSPSLVDLQDAAAMIFEGHIRVAPLVSHRLPLSEIRQAFALYQAGKAIKVFIDTD